MRYLQTESQTTERRNAEVHDILFYFYLFQIFFLLINNVVLKNYFLQTQTVALKKQEPEVNYNNLAAFLNRITPQVLEYLDEIYGSNAFDDYDPETSRESSIIIHSLTKFNSLEEESVKVDTNWA